MIRWRWSRWIANGIRPLEIWDRPSGQSRLFERCGTTIADQLALAGLRPEQIAATMAEPMAEALNGLARENRVRSIFVGGGLAESVELRSALTARIDAPLCFAPRPQAVAMPGGLAVIGGRSGVVVDVGQTAIKLFDGTLTVIPWRPDDRGSVDLLAKALVAARPLAAEAVLALPCPLDADGVPGQTSLPGWGGDRQRVPRILARAGELVPAHHPWHGREIPVQVLNDAELAAVSARSELPASNLPALVVTLGYGPGAAVLEGGA